MTIFTTRRPPSATPGAARIEPFTSERDWRDGARIVIEAAESEHPEQAAFDAWRFSVHRKDAAAGRCRERLGFRAVGQQHALVAPV
jgi:hypothetical protein